MKKLQNFPDLLGKIFLLSFCIFLLLTVIFKLNIFNHDWLRPNYSSHFITEVKGEQYNPNLSFINSMPKLKKYFLNEIESKKLTNIESIYFADQLLRNRFYHGDKLVSIDDNWFLYLFNLFTKNRNNSLYISSVDPNYILKSNHALCNQQALIFQELMQTIGIDYQSVLFNIPRYPASFGHFASAALIDKNWYFIDTNLEPLYLSKDSSILPRLLNSDIELFNSLYPEYNVSNIPSGSISTSSLNQNPAFFGYLLQEITYIISNYFWLLCLFAYFFCRFFLNKKL